MSTELPTSGPSYGPQTIIGEQTHAEKYRLEGESFEGYAERVSRVLGDDEGHRKAFRQLLLEQKFCPGGRIQSSIGSPKNTTAFNCYVSGTIEDSFVEGEGSIMHRAMQAAATMRMGGGIGYNWGTLRPRGALIKKLMSGSSGPLGFMPVFDAACRATSSAGNRRGAQMGVMPVWHPDIEEFIDAKKPPDSAQPIVEEVEKWRRRAAAGEEGAEQEFMKWYMAMQSTLKLTGFNLSVGITDEFMEAVLSGTGFDLRFNGDVHRTIDARELWEKIMLSTWDWAEPGVLFLDTINRMNNLRYCETIVAVNPCFTGDTLVWTDQGARRFDELAASGRDVQVLTQNTEGRLVYRTMRNPRRTQRKANLVRVTLDNGQVVRCTPQHKFFLKDGREVAAGDLQVGDSLQSVRRDLINQVVSVEILQEVEDVYCGTVEETHSFFIQLGQNDGVLVRNCGEQPLPPFGACLLGSYNLTKYLHRRSDRSLYFAMEELVEDVAIVTRAMDNVVEASRYPLPEQEKEARSKRRMGQGVMGLANALEVQGMPYGSPAFLAMEEKILAHVNRAAYRASSMIAVEKGSFKLFDAEKYLESEFVNSALDPDTIDMIRRQGIRNSHLTSLAPTGTIALGCDNISSSLEPVFSHAQKRIIKFNGGTKEVDLLDWAFANHAVRGRKADSISAQEHLSVLITAQRYVDSAVSKTCNVPPSMPWADFKQLYMTAWENGCKGCTTFNIGGKRAGILKDAEASPEGGACKIDPATGQRSCE